MLRFDYTDWKQGWTVWIERDEDGWWVRELGGNWGLNHGPYKRKLTAIIVWFLA